MKVYLIGAGPGDPGLFTLRGRELLGEADVIVYDALANAKLLEFAKPEAELIYVGKVADKHALPQDQINALLARKAREKGLVARLKGGDPYIFGRGGEEAEYLVGQGIPFEEVPGISSAIAAPAYAGIPLTHRDHVSSVMIATGHEQAGKSGSSLNWRAMAASGSTLVFLMGMKNLHDICANLIDAGMAADMPSAVICRGTTPMQRNVFAPLGKLAAEAHKAGVSNPAVIVVGKVCGLRDQLDWLSNKPLLGRSIVVTRAREQASELSAALASLGARALECPALEIQPLRDYTACDAAIANLDAYGWIIFTSVNGVKYFWQRLDQAGKDSRALGACKIAAIGPATAAALEGKGIKADLTPASYVAESVAEALISVESDNLKGMRILLPRAAKARMALPDALAVKGAIVDIAPVYEAAPAPQQADEIRALGAEGALDCITFGSSSTVENFLAMASAEEVKSWGALIAAIGPITAQTLRKHGLEPQIQPDKFTIPALVEAIATKFAQVEA